jgi:Ca-activated chloride channel homolog
VTILAPLALIALIIVPLIYLIHLLFGSRKRLRVPAVFLWANLPPAPSARRKRRWPPLTLLLLLQLVAAILGALALARPATPADPPRHLALVLDASASMQATDVAPTRFDAARARGLERVASLRDGEMVSVVRSGTTASLLTSGAPQQGRQALATAKPGAGPGTLRDALALASAQVAATPDLRGEIVVLTDGASPPLEPLGVLAAPVEVVPVGGGSDNQAVTALQVRIEPSGREQVAYVEVSNYADQPAQVTVRTLADDAPLDERAVRLAPRGQTRVSVPLPADARRVTSRLLGRDALSLDRAPASTTCCSFRARPRACAARSRPFRSRV